MVLVRNTEVPKKGVKMKDLIYKNNVYELRKEQNISQDRLANALGISRRSVSKIENGDQNPSLEMAYRIAAYFQLFVQEVFPLMDGVKLPTMSDTPQQE